MTYTMWFPLENGETSEGNASCQSLINHELAPFRVCSFPHFRLVGTHMCFCAMSCRMDEGGFRFWRETLLVQTMALPVSSYWHGEEKNWAGKRMVPPSSLANRPTHELSDNGGSQNAACTLLNIVLIVSLYNITTYVHTKRNAIL
jgi:hypothetical protein